MSKNHSELATVNSSGFPLQLRVAAELQAVSSRSEWSLVAQERLWRDEPTGDYGFIDIIAADGLIRLVIECKKAADSKWLFLVPKTSREGRATRVKMLCTSRLPEVSPIQFWADHAVLPESHESAFAVVRGENKKEPTLERLAAGLIKSIDAHASNELSIQKEGRPPERRMYVPVIVTAASLLVCSHEAERVDLASGELPADAAEFHEVPFLRFRKEMSAARPSHEALSQDSWYEEAERTILIVQAKELGAFLTSWRVPPQLFGQWPLARAEAVLGVGGGATG